MISKASELLELFIHEEKEKLKEFDMPHMPTLGTAYEEITKQGIDSDFAIPKSLNLKVVSGFISADGVMLPEQIDCMPAIPVMGIATLLDDKISRRLCKKSHDESPFFDDRFSLAVLC